MTTPYSTLSESSEIHQSSVPSLWFLQKKEALLAKIALHSRPDVTADTLREETQAFKITSPDTRWHDAIIIWLDGWQEKDIPLDLKNALEEYLKLFPATPIIFCYSQDRKSLKTLASLWNILQYPNIRLFSISYMISSGGEWNPFDFSSIPRSRTKTNKGGQLSYIEHGIGRYRKQPIENIDKTMLTDCQPQISQARLIGITWDDRAVMEQILTVTIRDDTNVEIFHAPSLQLNMTCVDWDGTLMKDGVFQESVFETAQNIAHAHQQSLVVWTWGGRETILQIQEFFMSRGQHIMTCAKQDCEWGIISYTIDDETAEDLKRKYGFTVSNLIPVS